VLANDTDADFDSVSAALVSGPSHGTLSLQPGGSLTYTPGGNMSCDARIDSFTYRVSDATGPGNVATVKSSSPQQQRCSSGY
jgi:hypothetical protein